MKSFTAPSFYVANHIQTINPFFLFRWQCSSLFTFHFNKKQYRFLMNRFIAFYKYHNVRHSFSHSKPFISHDLTESLFLFSIDIASNKRCLCSCRKKNSLWFKPLNHFDLFIIFTISLYIFIIIIHFLNVYCLNDAVVQLST